MAKPTCAVDGCEKNARNRGWCSAHYERWRKFGSTDGRRPSVEERFWSKVDTTSGPDACWPWSGTMGSNGYGVFSIHLRYSGAHRVAYELSTGEQLGDKHVDHLCFNRRCVNPRHLRAVTQKQNNEHRQGAQRNSTTGVQGVSPFRDGRYRAAVFQGGKNYHVGVFATINEAAEAVRLKRCELQTHNDADRR